MDGQYSIKKFYLNQIEEILTQKQPAGNEAPNKTQENVQHEAASSNKQSEKHEVEVVVFKNQRVSRSSATNSTKKKTLKATSASEDTNLLKAKQLLKEIEWDVTSFGLKGFSLTEKRKMEQDRAIRLGAQPRKSSYVNYKVLMEERKRQKEVGDKKQVKQKRKRTVFWKESQSMSTGMKGKFKDGVLKLSKQDMDFG